MAPVGSPSLPAMSRETQRSSENLLSHLVMTSSIRIFVTGTQDGYSRIVEVEAWGASSAGTSTYNDPDDTKSSSRPSRRTRAEVLERLAPFFRIAT